MPPKKVVLLACGSFNPPTFMHLRMFEIARDTLNRQGYYKVIGGVMSPVHDSYGKKDLVSASHRCAMVRLALCTSSWVQLSDWECKQEAWVPTRRVLQYHQNTMNSIINDSDSSSPQKRQRLDDLQWLPDEARYSCGGFVQVKLLCGADLLESFGTPGLWKEEDLEAIVGQHGLVVITREGSNPYKFIYESDMLTKYQNNIQIVPEWIANDVSSTKIRRSLRRGESVKYLIPDEVLIFLESHSLYSTEDNKYGNKSTSISLFPTPSPSDVHMSSSSPTLYLNEINSRSSSSSGGGGGGFLAPPNTNRAQRPPSLLIEEAAAPDKGTHKKSVPVTTSFPGQAVQVLEVRPQAEGATDKPNASDSIKPEPPEHPEHPEHQHDPSTGDAGELTAQTLCDDQETKVQIQITKDGIRVISDKETTV